MSKYRVTQTLTYEVDADDPEQAESAPHNGGIESQYTVELIECDGMFHGYYDQDVRECGEPWRCACGCEEGHEEENV